MKLTPRYLLIWLIILLIYLAVLYGIGQIAFTKQYFNDAENMVGEFLVLKEKFNVNTAENEDTDDLINSLMQSSANSSNDLQELASQSFNIILGALLAFLSASATVVFQALTSSSEPSPTTRTDSLSMDKRLKAEETQYKNRHDEDQSEPRL